MTKPGEKMSRLIDVWNLSTFDGELIAELRAEAELLCNYALTDKKNFSQQQAAEGWQRLAANPYADSRNWFVEHVIMPAMERRTIRAWHYTRLTDEEVALLQTGGVYSSTLATIRQRIDTQVFNGTLPANAAEALYEASPFHHQDTRSGKFWMSSHPISINDSGVEPLLEHWGGEGVYFWLKDPNMIEAVKGIGRPRVIEVAVPLEVTTHAYSAAKAVVATFVRTMGCEDDWAAFDLYTTRALGAEAVLGIHTEGEPHFEALARGFPAAFVDREP